MFCEQALVARDMRDCTWFMNTRTHLPQQNTHTLSFVWLLLQIICSSLIYKNEGPANAWLSGYRPHVGPPSPYYVWITLTLSYISPATADTQKYPFCLRREKNHTRNLTLVSFSDPSFIHPFMNAIPNPTSVTMGYRNHTHTLTRPQYSGVFLRRRARLYSLRSIVCSFVNSPSNKSSLALKHVTNYLEICPSVCLSVYLPNSEVAFQQSECVPMRRWW